MPRANAAGIALDIVGAAAGNPTEAPETLLRGYDLVFAKGRTALEALAVGCATVVADAAGAGPLVVPDNYEVLRLRNFGIRELSGRTTCPGTASRSRGPAPLRSAEVSARVREEAGMEPAIDRLLTIYAVSHGGSPGHGSASRAAAAHLCRHIAQPLKQCARNLETSSDHDPRISRRRERDLDTCAHAGAGQALAQRPCSPGLRY